MLRKYIFFALYAEPYLHFTNIVKNYDTMPLLLKFFIIKVVFGTNEYYIKISSDF